jgi:hypothetical protein
MAQIFGRRLSGQLVPALYDGGVALHDLEQALRDTGTVVDEETIRKFAEAEEVVSHFFESIKRGAFVWSAAVITAFDDASDALARFLERGNEAYRGTRQVIATALLPLLPSNAADRTSGTNAGIIDAMRSQLPGGARGPQTPNAPSRTRTSRSGRSSRSDLISFTDAVTLLGGRVTSGLRTAEEQRALFNSGATTTLNSAHLTGRAADVVGLSRAEIGEAARMAGVTIARARPETGVGRGQGTGAHWHIELRGDGARVGSVSVPAPTEPVLGEWEGPSGGITAGQMIDAEEWQRASLAAIDIRDALVELPIPIEVISEEDQERLERFAEDFAQGLADGLAGAIVYGEDLGDALVDTIRRAAAELISTSLMDLLTGRSGGNSMIGQLAGSIFGVGPAGGGVKLGPGKAGGGDVFPGTIYPVGEKGIELFAPKVPGVIIPNHALGGGQQRVEVAVRLDSSMLRAEIVQGSGAVVAQAAPIIEQRAAGKALAGIMRRRLP